MGDKQETKQNSSNEGNRPDCIISMNDIGHDSVDRKPVGQADTTEDRVLVDKPEQQVSSCQPDIRKNGEQHRYAGLIEHREAIGDVDVRERPEQAEGVDECEHRDPVRLESGKPDAKVNIATFRYFATLMIELSSVSQFKPFTKQFRVLT